MMRSTGVNVDYNMDVPVITGYYRYTDIWFDWYVYSICAHDVELEFHTIRHQALSVDDDRGPLKAVLAHDALVHPDNPLRKPGVNGIELYHGQRRSTNYTV